MNSAFIIVWLALLLSAPLTAPSVQVGTQGQAGSAAAKGSAMQEIHGTFDVKLNQQAQGPADGIASRLIEKTYAGGLTGTAKGEMLSAGDPATGNAGYVAIERVDGKLDGKAGTFALMQTGAMSKGSAPKLDMIVVPGSGTGDLSGLYGAMTIAIAANGAHSYTFRYAFAS